MLPMLTLTGHLTDAAVLRMTGYLPQLGHEPMLLPRLALAARGSCSWGTSSMSAEADSTTWRDPAGRAQRRPTSSSSALNSGVPCKHAGHPHHRELLLHASPKSIVDRFIV